MATVKTRRGFAKLEWQKLRRRNEALDCRVYARAAVWILGKAGRPRDASATGAAAARPALKLHGVSGRGWSG